MATTDEDYQKAIDKFGGEILSLKSVLLTALTKIEAMEKKITKKPSKKAQDFQQGVDAQYARRMKTILKNQQTKH